MDLADVDVWEVDEVAEIIIFAYLISFVFRNRSYYPKRNPTML